MIGKELAQDIKDKKSIKIIDLLRFMQQYIFNLRPLSSEEKSDLEELRRVLGIKKEKNHA